jgi:hypothetical protein
MNKETLEEAADNWVRKPVIGTKRESFIAGAKWQADRMGLMEIELNHTKTLLASCEQALEDRDKKAERMYSEEEVIELLNKREDCINQTSSILDYTSTKEWFEQFKKK